MFGTSYSEDPFAEVQSATRKHRASHGCGAYTFEDGPSLRELVESHQSKRVLELGTALGYTACCMAGGSAEVQIDTVENDPTHVALAREQIAAHGLDQQITVHEGDFDAVLSRFLPGYDLAFFDGFAPPVDTILRLRELLLDGGVLVCSNLQLAGGWGAKLLQEQFADPTLWQSLDSIEGGKTLVLIKQG